MIVDVHWLNEKNRNFRSSMNSHQLKDEINKTHREAYEYQSDASTEKDPIRKAFLERRVKELRIKYEQLKGEKLVFTQTIKT